MFPGICKAICVICAAFGMFTSVYLSMAGADWTFAAFVAGFSLLGVTTIGEING